MSSYALCYKIQLRNQNPLHCKPRCFYLCFEILFCCFDLVFSVVFCLSLSDVSSCYCVLACKNLTWTVMFPKAPILVAEVTQSRKQRAFVWPLTSQNVLKWTERSSFRGGRNQSHVFLFNLWGHLHRTTCPLFTVPFIHRPAKEGLQ